MTATASAAVAGEPLPLECQVPVLQARGLAFAYPGRAPVFEDVSLVIARREIVCLLGGSGCGKSTLLHLLSGLEAPRSGGITFLGQALSQPHPRTALVFQQAGLLPWLDVMRNTAFGLDFARQPRVEPEVRQARVSAALQAVGLAGHERVYPAELSGGMAQRVALARALSREPELLFADEPFSALDAITRAEMQILLVDLVHRWQAAVLLVTHDIDEAILVADRILLMAGSPGRISEEWKVEIPRPRETHAAATTALRLRILRALRSAGTDAAPSVQ